MNKCMFIFIMTMVMGSIAYGLSDDFEDGVIDTSLWVIGGAKRSYLQMPAGSWDCSHEEIMDTDSYLRTRVWGPTSGVTYGHDAWIRTKHDFNDGKSYLVNFTWEAEVVGEGWVDFYFIQITDGYTPANANYNWPIVNPPVGTTDLLWDDSGGNPVNCWTLLGGMAKTSMSIKITPDGTAKLYDGPNGSGNLLHQGSLNPNVEWYIRFMVSDATSAGHPGGDSRINLYDFSVVSEPTYEWHTYNGHQYAVTKDYCNWADAEAEAVALGGHLVTINDAAENAWLTATFGGYDDAGHHGVWAHLLWIGFEHTGGDMSNPSNWQWVSGQPVTYIGTWYDGSPVGPPGGGPHAYLHPSTHPIPGTWFNAAARDTNPVSYPHGIIEIGEPPTPPEPWSFVHMTDTHIGWCCGMYLAEERLAGAIYEINHSPQKPEFILVSGDIVENAWFGDIEIPAYYKLFHEVLTSLDDSIKVYTVPGNHDRYAYVLDVPPCESRSLEIYNRFLGQPDGTTELIPPNNYAFDHNGITLIGLDSGKDVNWPDVRGTGLLDDQMDALEDLDPTVKKIVFMHHPAMHTDNEDKVIANNRNQFITYCEQNNVQLVLAGHTHEDHTFDVNGVKYIQTPSTAKDHGEFEHGYRFIHVREDKTYPQAYSRTRLISEIKAIIASLFSPAKLHIYDSLGGHVGIVDSNEAERGIPDSFYFSHYVVPTEDGNEVFPEKIIIFDPCDDYSYEVVGTEGGTYLLEISSTEDGNDTIFEANEIPTLPGSVHQYTIDWDALSEGEEGVTLRVDRDGDGDYEKTVISDGVLTGEEFNTPSVVEIIVPEAGSAVQDGITLTAEASDLDGIDAVYFYLREPNDGNGVPIGYEDLAATLNSSTGQWEYVFDTTQLPDGYYVILAKAIDTYGNEGWSEVVPFSIRNWAVIELLPASESNKAGRTMPVKFALRIVESVDPAMPFVYNEGLEIRIYDAADQTNILQTSLYGDTSRDYRIDSAGELYITNFKTKRIPTEYVVEIWRTSKNFLVGSFTFETVK